MGETEEESPREDSWLEVAVALKVGSFGAPGELTRAKALSRLGNRDISLEFRYRMLARLTAPGPPPAEMLRAMGIGRLS